MFGHCYSAICLGLAQVAHEHLTDGMFMFVVLSLFRAPSCVLDWADHFKTQAGGHDDPLGNGILNRCTMCKT